jgi:glutamate-ammonia-ligase adenylyltransferase
VQKEALSAAAQLRADFSTHTARVRAFVERHFGRESLAGYDVGNIADIILSETIPETLSFEILLQAGFSNARRALTNIRNMAPDTHLRDLLAPLAVLAADMLKSMPEPDMAFNNWERFVSHRKDIPAHYEALLSQPTRLHILLSIFSTSRFLADTLIRNPEFFDWVTTPEILHAARDKAAIEEELRALARKCGSHDEWLDAMRRLRRREILRIGTRDICLRAPISDITEELSTCAEAIVQVTMDRLIEELSAATAAPARAGNMFRRFCVMAFGKLGGRELNYSSDIDLLGVYEPVASKRDGQVAIWTELYNRLMERLSADLSNHTQEGYAYRVDTRIRPYGSAGGLAHSIGALKDYYTNHAALWEIQALLKLRPVAGNRHTGEKLRSSLLPLVRQKRPAADIAAAIEHMRRAVIRHTSRQQAIDIKNGKGGIRDIEFLVQGLQLVYCVQHEKILSANTISAIEALALAGLIARDIADALRRHYVLLRRIEHFLQLLEDRQVHVLPQHDEEIEALAKRVMGSSYSSDSFLPLVRDTLDEVHSLYIKYLVSAA